MRVSLIIIAAAVALAAQSSGVAASVVADQHRSAMNQKIAAEGARQVVELRAAEMRRFYDDIRSVDGHYPALAPSQRDGLKLKIADKYAERFASYLAAYAATNGSFVAATKSAIKSVHTVQQQAAVSLGRDDFAAVLKRHHLKAAFL